MSFRDDHPRDDLQRLLDGRLDGDRGAALEAHLEGCAACRDELATLRWMKRRFPSPADDAAPAGLEATLRAALDAEDARARRSDPRAWRWSAIAAGAVVAIAFAVALWRAPERRADLATLAAAELAAVEAGDPAEGRLTSEPGVLEEWFAASGLGFEIHVYDLAMMDLRLVGGRTVSFAGGPAGRYHYRTGDGRIVVCEMYRGTMADLPADGASRARDDGLVARVFERDGVTLVFWREGEVICFLAARLPSEDVVALAFAKAARLEA